MPKEQGASDNRTPADRAREVYAATPSADDAMKLLKQVLGKEPFEEGEVIESLPIESIDLDAQIKNKPTSRVQEAQETPEALDDDVPHTEEPQERPITLVSKHMDRIKKRLSPKQKDSNAVELSQGSNEMTGPPMDEQDQALSTLPAEQQRQLEAVDPQLLAEMAKGPSSFIDQDAFALLQKLPKEHQLSFWEMVLSPKEGFKQLAAQGRERQAKATIRDVVANVALDMAENAAQDMTSKMFAWRMDQLRKKYDIEKFSQELGIQEIPEEGSFQESEILLRIHYTWLAKEKRSKAIQQQMQFIVAEEVKLKGELAIINIRTQMLPQLRAANLKKDAAMAKANADNLQEVIDARAQELPLRRTAAGQKAAHITGLATTVVVAGATGFVVGIPGGIAIGGKEAGAWVGQKWAETDAKIKANWQDTRAKIDAFWKSRASNK